MPLVSQVEIDHRGFEVGVPQVALDEARIDARFQQMGGVGMAQAVDGHAHCGDPGSVLGFTEGPLDTRALHGGSGRWTVGVIAPGGGKEPGGVPMGFPGATEKREGLGGQRDVAICGALAAVDMDMEALAINVGDLEGEGFMESEAHTRDGGEVDLIVQGGRRLKQTSDFFHTEDGGETV